MLAISMRSYSGINEFLLSSPYPSWKKSLHTEKENILKHFTDFDRMADTTKIDTIGLLTSNAWVHKKRGERIIPYVRKYHFMKDGTLKVEIKKGTPEEDIGIGTWHRKGNIIFTEFEGYTQHENEILKISEDTLLLYFRDKDVIDVFEKP